LLSDLRVVQQMQHRLCHCNRIARWNEDRGPLVFNQERNSAYIRADDGHPTRERLKKRDRHVIVQARIDEHIGLHEELCDTAIVETASELDVRSHAELMR